MATLKALRAEAVERAALADVHRVAGPTASAELGLELRNVDGALLSMAAGDPNIVINRVVGLGLAHVARRSAVATIVGSYEGAGVGRYFLHLDPAAVPEDLPDWLEAAGLEPYKRAWAKFTRDASPPSHQSRSDLEVRRIGVEHAMDFGRIAAAGFELDERWVPVLANLVGRAGWQHYVSFDGDRPAGCGAMRIFEKTGWMDWAATLPEFRRRGSQGAILERRIADGIEAGCEAFATCTGEAVEGDPQHSYRNIERYGFRRTHARANWVPAAA